MSRAIALVHEEEGRYGISFPDFPGCVSGGKCLDEAIGRGAAALAFRIEGLLEGRDPMPRIRSVAELRKDPAFREEAEGAVVVTVPVEPARSHHTPEHSGG